MSEPYRGFSSGPRLVQKVTADVASIPASTSPVISFTVPGSQPGTFFVVAAPSLETGLAIADAHCTVAGTVRVRIVNSTIGAVDPASQAFYFLGL